MPERVICRNGTNSGEIVRENVGAQFRSLRHLSGQSAKSKGARRSVSLIRQSSFMEVVYLERAEKFADKTVIEGFVAVARSKNASPGWSDVRAARWGIPVKSIGPLVSLSNKQFDGLSIAEVLKRDIQ